MNIGLLGYGVVGHGVDTLIKNNRNLINERLGIKLEVVSILRRKEFFDKRSVKSINEFLNSNLDIVVEAMGGIDPAYDYVKKCLERKIHVVTSNKQLIFEKGDELFNIAKENNVNLCYEAAVGGAIPIVKTFYISFMHENIDYILGILNGTSNYVLTRMYDNSLSLKDSVEQAQKLGYAEQNPTDDIEGYDAARKIAILASLITGKKVILSDIKCKGISDINKEDIDIAKLLNAKIKLIARADIDKDGISISVEPHMVINSSIMYFIDGVLNAVIIGSNAAGDVMISANGAGAFPTASAILSDIIFIANYSKNFSIFENLKRKDEKIILNNDKLTNYLLICDKVIDCGIYINKYINKYIYIIKNVSIKEINEIIKSYGGVKAYRLLGDLCL